MFGKVLLKIRNGPDVLYVQENGSRISMVSTAGKSFSCLQETPSWMKQNLIEYMWLKLLEGGE